VFAALTIAIGGLTAGAFWFALAPVTLTLAVAADGLDEKVMRAFADTLTHRDSDLRIRLRLQQNAGDAAMALQTGRVDLAVVRSDLHYPANAGTVAILRERTLLLVAPEGEASLRTLAIRKVGALAFDSADATTLSAMLAHFELGDIDVVVFDDRSRAIAALGAGEIGALAVLANIGDRETANLLRDLEQATPKGVAILPVDEAAALAAQFPYLTTTEIPAGAFGGRAPRPAEAVNSVALSFHLAAGFGVDRRYVSKLAELLFGARVRIARTAPSVVHMTAPDTDEATSALLPNHPGAIDYFQREQKTFMDRWGDWIWLGFFGIGGASSALAWLTSVIMRRRRAAVEHVLAQACELLPKVRSAPDLETLGAYALNADQLVLETVAQTQPGHAAAAHANARDLSAMILIVDSVRAAIMERRQELSRIRQPSARTPADLRLLLEEANSVPRR
jgi:TRAP-type uncharacterized transport system substrate-binding protein